MRTAPWLPGRDGGVEGGLWRLGITQLVPKVVRWLSIVDRKNKGSIFPSMREVHVRRLQHRVAY